MRQNLFLAFLFFLGLSSVNQQLSAEDVTASYITNPGFEDGDNGWTGLLRGSGTASYPNFTNRFIEAWRGQWVSTPIPSSDTHQELANLPEGIYTLSAAVLAVEQSNPSLVVTGVSLYAGEKSIACNTGDGAPEIFEVPPVYVAEGGTLRIGLKVDAATLNANWIAVDNFKLERSSAAELVDPYLSQADTFLEQVMQAGFRAEVVSRKEAIESLDIATTPLEDVFDAIDQLIAAMDAAKSSVAEYAALKLAIDNAHANKSSYQDYPGYTAFVGAISLAQGIYNDALTEVTSATADLQTAEKTCRFTQSPSADFTWAIVNPGFEDGNTGWPGTLGSLNTTSYLHFNGRFMETWTDGNKGALGNKDAYQVIEGLPEGYYSLSAAVNATRQNNASLEVSGVSLYAGGQSVACHTGNGVPERYEVPAAYVTEGGSLRIGLRIVSTDANWVSMDNFKLTYHGMTATRELLDALVEQTDKAAFLTLDDVSPAAVALNTERSGHLNYELGITAANAVANAILTMKDAIETYRSAYIKNYSFEDFQDPYSTGVSTLNNWTRSTTDGYNWSGCNGDWKTDGYRGFGIYKNAIDSDFEMFQTLTVPNGTYRVTVDMTVAKAGTTSRVNGQRLFAANMESYYPVSAETPSDNGAAHTLSVTAVVTDGQLKLGVRTNGGTELGVGWFKIDNFAIKQISDNVGWTLTDDIDFHASDDQAVDVSYVRCFSATGVNSTTSNGWQTLCLPFDVTSIEINDTHSQSVIDLTNEANRKFWLFLIDNGVYTETDVIEANKYYLITLPNDVDYYVPGISLSGDVTFSGNAVSATTALAPVEMTAYHVKADYKCMNTGYGILDESGISVFKQGHCNGAFWPHALPKDAGIPALQYKVFGDNDPTSLRQMSFIENASKPEIVNVEGGLEITTVNSQLIRVYTFGGQLVKSIQVPAGTSVIRIPSGQYVVNGQKIVVNK